MPRPRAFRELRLLNGSTGDPCLFVDDQGRDNALLIDCGDNAVLGDDRLADLEAVFLTHHHVDHFIGFDRVVRANLDRDKAVHFYRERKGQALHGRVDANAASQSEIGSLSDLQFVVDLPFVVHADSKVREKTAASAGPRHGDRSRSRWAAGVAPSRTRRF